MLKKCRLLAFVLFSLSFFTAKAQGDEISVNGNVLKFASLSSYETYASDDSKWEELLEYVKNNDGITSIEETNPEDTVHPDFLRIILNEDHIVEIGSFFVKIDVANNRGLAIQSNLPDAYENLKNDNLDAEGLFVFDMEEEDAIEILEKVESGELNAENYREFIARRSCRGAEERKAKDPNPVPWHFGTSPSSPCPDGSLILAMDNKAVYQRFIIFFSLQAKIRSVWGASCSNWIAPPLYPGVDLKLSGKLKYSRRCQTEERFDKSLDIAGASTLNWRAYNSSRSLSKYHWEVYFYIKPYNSNANYVQSRLYEISYGY